MNWPVDSVLYVTVWKEAAWWMAHWCCAAVVEVLFDIKKGVGHAVEKQLPGGKNASN